jgi:hypothetical protein
VPETPACVAVRTVGYVKLVNESTDDQTVAEERVDEPLVERVARELPERERTGPLDDVAEPDADTIAEIEAENIAAEIMRDIDAGALLPRLGGTLDDPLLESGQSARVGRLVAPGADDDAEFAYDEESDVIARDVEQTDLSAEEEAMHIIDDSLDVYDD